MNDTSFVSQAVEAAAPGIGHTRPNPPVGAVVVKDGRVIGVGCHLRCGGAHAEVNALRNVVERGESAEGTTLYVSLEPCSKPGRVGACTDAIIAAKVARVVYAIPDPNPVNRGKAAEVLAKVGIPCECYEHIGDDECVKTAARELIAPFAKHVTTGLPFVTVKIAMSLDGKICDDFGDARWVSSEESRKATGCMREQVDAIMVGAETVRKDNPSLLSHGQRNDDLIRVVISASGNLPSEAQIFTDGAPNETLVYRNPREALEDLGRKGIMHVLCEGGMKLAVSLVEAGLVDRWLTVLAPCIIGSRHISEKTNFIIGSDPMMNSGDIFLKYSLRVPNS